MIVYDLKEGRFIFPQGISRDELEKAVSAIASTFERLSPDAAEVYYRGPGEIEIAIDPNTDKINQVCYNPKKLRINVINDCTEVWSDNLKISQ